MTDAKPMDTVAFLDKVLALYPAGVPQKLVRVPQVEHVVADANIKTIFIAIYRSGQMAPEDAEFLGSIATKGLKLTAAEYHVAIAAGHEQGESQLSELSASLRPKIAVVFGDSEPSGAVAHDAVQLQGGTLGVIRAPALSLLASNGDAKRSFWKLLQGVLPLLAEG